MTNPGTYDRRRFLATVLMLALLAILTIPAAIRAVNTRPRNGSSSTLDVLAYTVTNYDSKKSMLLYDPVHGVRTPISTLTEFNDFSFSVDGRIAFSSTREGSARIQLLNVLSGDGSIKKLDHNPAANDYPLAWSPDGRYLAYESYQDPDNRFIYVWDGKRTINVTPNDPPDTAKAYDVAWSRDGRLAFTIWLTFSYPYKGDPSEIYLWDGKTTTDLSQNPTGEDRDPTWNTDGRLAFQSARDGEYDVFVWDGMSVKGGSPDMNTFTNISPELTSYFSSPTWTKDGLLAFDAVAPQDTHSQIYVWDGKTATNISQNPPAHNGGAVWNADGRWAFATYFSPQQMVYVRDANNRSLVTVEGEYGPAWSSSGDLAFCRRDPSRGWILLEWDGKYIDEVARGWQVWGQWRSGQTVICSSG